MTVIFVLYMFTFFVAHGKNTVYKNNPHDGPPNAGRMLVVIFKQKVNKCFTVYKNWRR